jgi:Holliday junction resolvase-like predicted endonuclease
MAKVYGQNRGYLIRQDLRNFFLASVLVVIWLAGALFLIKNPVSNNALLLLIVIILGVLVTSWLTGFFLRKSYKFYRGFSGEKEIAKTLGELPDDFSVFQDVIVGDNKGNLDFVVTGPGGIFIIEVKAHRGKIGFDGRNLTVRNRAQNFLRQAHGEMWALKQHLSQKIKQEVHIYSIIVFSSPYATLNTGSSSISGVYILPKYSLVSFLLAFPQKNYPRESIEAALKKNIRP